MRAFVTATSILLLTSVLIGPAIGQEEEEEAEGGVLYLSSQVVPGGACASAVPVVNDYALTETLPAAGKAYTGSSAGGFSCDFDYKYTAKAPSVLTGTIDLVIEVGCDVAGQAIEMDYQFFVGSNSVSGLVRPAVSWACDSSSDLFTYRQSFEGKNTKVRIGDVLTLYLNLFAAATVPNSPAQNWHVKTGGSSNPSRITGVGLPGTVGDAPLVESFELTPNTAKPRGIPGENIDVPFSVKNLGTVEANFTTGVMKTPPGFTVGFDRAAGKVGAGGTLKINAKVQIPNDAADGGYSVTVSINGTNGGTAKTFLTFEVGPPGGSAVPSNATSDSGGPAGAPAGSPGLGGLAAILAVAAGVLLLRRRRAP